MSELLEAVKSTVSGTLPWVVDNALAAAMGGVGAARVVTTAIAELVALEPSRLLTCTVTAKAPTLLKTWLVVTPVPMEPSPNDQV